MQFIPNTPLKKSMLQDLGVQDIDDLFCDIPRKIRVKTLDLPEGLTQLQAEEQLRILAQKNKSFCDMPSFLGGGVKPHYIPAAVKAVVSRS